MQDSIIIREFVESDMERVKQIETASLRELTPLSSIQLFYEIPKEGFIVAEDGGKVVGFLVANVRSPLEGELEGHILSIAVDPEYRRRGIGACLVTGIINTLKNKGVRKVALEVKLKNHGAREFYRLLGFKESHVVKHYYRMRGYTEDALVMSKEL